MPEHAEIAQAASRLTGHVRPTPIIELHAAELGVPVTFKLELLQHTGSFKARGAFNRMLTTDVSAGVVAASGGNHGAAVAYAAQALGVPATIFVPAPTPQTKLARIAAYGAKVVQGGANYAEAHAASQLWAEGRGTVEVHAYDDPAVLAGQGTIGLELEAAAPALTHVLVAVGGGGLIGGIASWYGARGAKVIAVEPDGCATLHGALQAGRPVPVATGGLAADSLGARQIGGLAFAVASALQIPSVLVGDDAIRAAQRWLWDHMRLVSEPGGATALAALLSGGWQAPASSRVSVILCGGNTDPASVLP